MVETDVELFWFSTPKTLIQNPKKCIPRKSMTTVEKLNACTRLTIIVCLVVLLLDYSLALKICVFSLLIIILIYFFNKKETMLQENFSLLCPSPSTPQNNFTPFKPCTKLKVCPSPCTVPRDVGGDGKIYARSLKSMAGNANPKTYLQPIVVAKSHDLDYWRANEFVTHSHINDQLRIDDYQSGYSSIACNSHQIRHNPSLKYVSKCDVKYGQTFDLDSGDDVKEGYQYPYQQTKPYDLEMKPITQDDDLNDLSSYEPKRLSVNRPSNLPGGVCNESKQLTDYNRNIFTSIIQPGIYKKHDIIEQQTSNYGISHTQQFPQVTCDKTPNGELIYTEHDDRLSVPVQVQPNMDVIEAMDAANIYDPRFTGYGPNYRAYLDDMTGQPRYFYDDINAVRMPNYIVRSNIDHLDFADKYGPIQPGHEMGNTDTMKIREFVNNAWFDNSSAQRVELQERLMRKFNTRDAQRKMAPINTMSGRR